MGQEDLLAILRDETLNIVERLKAAVKLELVYWDQRDDPPNLSRDEFLKILNFMPFVEAQWKKRESSSGKYGLTGEDNVFAFEFSIPYGRMVFTYYVKGFFFEKRNLRGVEVQSFRLVKKVSKGKRLRLV